MLKSTHLSCVVFNRMVKKQRQIRQPNRSISKEFCNSWLKENRPRQKNKTAPLLLQIRLISLSLWIRSTLLKLSWWLTNFAWYHLIALIWDFPLLPLMTNKLGLIRNICATFWKSTSFSMVHNTKCHLMLACLVDFQPNKSRQTLLQVQMIKRPTEKVYRMEALQHCTISRLRLETTLNRMVEPIMGEFWQESKF